MPLPPLPLPPLFCRRIAATDDDGGGCGCCLDDDDDDAPAAAYPLRTGDGSSRPLRPMDMACSKLSGCMAVMVIMPSRTAAALDADIAGGLGSAAGELRVGDAFSFGKLMDAEWCGGRSCSDDGLLGVAGNRRLLQPATASTG